MPITPIKTNDAPEAIGTYSQAIVANNTAYISGQIPLVPSTMELVGEDFVAQAEQVFDNLTAICKAAGTGTDQLIKLTVYLTDLGNFALLNEVMSARLTAPYPARAAVEVSALPRGAKIEIDAIVALKN